MKSPKYEVIGGELKMVFKCPLCNIETTESKSLKVGPTKRHFCQDCLYTWIKTNVPEMEVVLEDT